MWVSQIYALTCYYIWTAFALDGSKLPLAPSCTFLVKNDWKGHYLSPFDIPSWLKGFHPHSLCLDAVLQSYLEATLQVPPNRLFVWPMLLAPCFKQHITQVICCMIEVSDSGQWAAFCDLRLVEYHLTPSVTSERSTLDARVRGVPPFPLVIDIFITTFTTYHASQWGPFLISFSGFLPWQKRCYPTSWEGFSPVICHVLDFVYPCFVYINIISFWLISVHICFASPL